MQCPTARLQCTEHLRQCAEGRWHFFRASKHFWGVRCHVQPPVDSGRRALGSARRAGCISPGPQNIFFGARCNGQRPVRNVPSGFGSARNADGTSPKPIDTVSELDALCRRPIGISRTDCRPGRPAPGPTSRILSLFGFSFHAALVSSSATAAEAGTVGTAGAGAGTGGPPPLATPDRVPVTNLPRLGKGIGGKGMAAFLPLLEAPGRFRKFPCPKFPCHLPAPLANTRTRDR